MATEAGERLAGILGREAAPVPASVQLKVDASHLDLAVEGIGHVQLPVSAEQARQISRVGQPARFGRGEETLTDKRVRDTWEIPKSLVHIEWSNVFGFLLDAMRGELGLPSASRLIADLHSVLVYEPGQFFVAHQDSEKSDDMIGTLVVTLPSAYTGGELVIGHGGRTVTYRGSRSQLSFIAFYADCRHEVRPVRSGYRITLTYNLILQGGASAPNTGSEALVSELGRCLSEHFTTRLTDPYSRGQTGPPNRLVYLLDHEYTARGLSWSRLKGTDAGRVSLLRAAADSSGCQAMLALADIQESWSAYEAEPEYMDEYGDWDEDDEDQPGDQGDNDEYALEELIESSIRLTQWVGPAGARPEDISLTVDGSEVCATTDSAALEPYASQYEGYMGNYGNTLDRWYRRAAVVMWPSDRDFSNRAEASPAWALDELRARIRSGDVAGAQAAATTLAPFWHSVASPKERAGLFGKAMRAAGELDDARIADMLLRPFQVESLAPGHVAPLARLARYGDQWMGELIRGWFGDPHSWAYIGGQDRREWLASLPGLCRGLRAKGGPGTAAAQRLLEISWDWLTVTIREALSVRSPSRRGNQLGDLGEPLAAVLEAAALVAAVRLRDDVLRFSGQQGDEMLDCTMRALRAAVGLPPDTRREGGFDHLAADCAKRLRARLACPARADDDWSIEPPSGCGCELCGTLGTFLRDRVQRTFEWPLAERRRHHVHSRIDEAELPVRHKTRRQGRPYTLVLAKSQALFENERQARLRDAAGLEWLTGEWKLAQ